MSDSAMTLGCLVRGVNDELRRAVEAKATGAEVERLELELPVEIVGRESSVTKRLAPGVSRNLYSLKVRCNGESRSIGEFMGARFLPFSAWLEAQDDPSRSSIEQQIRRELPEVVIPRESSKAIRLQLEEGIREEVQEDLLVKVATETRGASSQFGKLVVAVKVR